MTDRILDIRFIAPTGAFVFFVFLYSPKDFISYTNSLESIGWLLNLVGLLGFGFMISSITQFFISIMDLRSNKFEYNYLKIYNRLITKKDSKNARELATWIAMEKENKENQGNLVSSQMHKRWNFAMANYNFCTSLVFVWLFLLIILVFNKVQYLSGYAWIGGYFFLSVIFFLIFFINGRSSRKSVLQMDDLLGSRNNMD